MGDEKKTKKTKTKKPSAKKKATKPAAKKKPAAAKKKPAAAKKKPAAKKKKKPAAAKKKPAVSNQASSKTKSSSTKVEKVSTDTVEPQAKKIPRVTVVMRCKNADWVVGQALAGLFSQDYDDFELLVIDSGSTDRSLELLSHYPHRLIEIAPEDYYPGKVLNLGMRNCESEVVVFQNSDAVPLAPNSLRRLIESFDDPSVDATLTRQLPRPEADTWVRRDYDISFPDASATPPWITLSLPMAAMRRRAWEQHPFYSDAWGSEDTEWGQWAKDNGLSIVYVRDSLVMHSHNYTLKQLYGRRFIEGEADAFIYGREENLPVAALRMVGSTLKDVVACVRDGDFSDIAKVPARRAVFHWAYLKGHRHGAGRILNRDTDTSVGQRTVLSTHESNR